MEDIIYFNTYRDGKNLNVYMGVYNIFMLCNKNRVTFIHGNVHYPAEGGDFVIWPSSKSCDGIRPKQVSDAQGYVYLTNNPIIRGTVKSLAREKTIIYISQDSYWKPGITAASIAMSPGMQTRWE